MEIVRSEDLSYHGALKVLHKPVEARDPDLAEERIKREIQVMSENLHPNLLKIHDTDPNSKWFVSEYHPGGTLDENLEKYQGDFAKALMAIRPLIEGVSELHKKGIVHRDIKPHNVFIDSNGGLILGDFGLVYFVDDQRTRISGTLENVGSRDWMPGWAMGRRIEELTPAFDVFALGKLLWSMVSGKLILPLWYYDKDENNVEELFSDYQNILLANPFFAQCIVEDEHDCLSDASKLLEEVDKCLSIIEKDADILAPGVRRKCKVCGVGGYELFIDGDKSRLRTFGIEPTGSNTMKIFTCDHCGHVQLFNFPNRQDPPAWQD